MNAQETITKVREILKANGTATLLLSNGRVSKTITIKSFSEMPKYGNPPDQPNLVEFKDEETRQTIRIDASLIVQID